MKMKVRSVLNAAIMITVSGFVALSCVNFDDSYIWDKLNDHEQRIEQLEKLCRELNSNVEAIQVLLTAVQQNDYVTEIMKIVDQGVEVGYSITFAKGGTVNIYHGSDGATPSIGVKKANDGAYYWTSDGEWMTDEEGDMIPATVADTDNGYIVPQFRIVEGIWYISYDNGNSWRQIESIGESSMIIEFDYTSNEDYIIITLNNGDEIKIPQVDPVIQLSLYQSRDMFLKLKTTVTGEQVYIPIYSNTNNARIFTFELEDGATYRYSYTNLGDSNNYRTIICTFGQSIDKLSVAPLGYEMDKYEIRLGQYSEALDVIRELPKYSEGSYTGTFKNTNNAKTLVMFVGWGVDPELISASIQKIQGGTPSDDDLDNSEGYTSQEILNLTNVLRSNMSTHNIATTNIMEIAYNFWKRRDEFIYSSHTALDKPWDYWSYVGFTDSANTGLTITEGNGGYKRIDCSTFVRYVMNGIDYYSTPYYNALEWTTVTQGALAQGVETETDDPLVCRSGKIYLRHGKKHIVESANSSKYKFTSIYIYNSDGLVIQVLTGVASFVLPEGASYIRVEMRVSSSDDYLPAVKGVSPSAILKCLRIREDERLQVNAEVPLNGYRNTFQICPWFEENGYGLEAYKDYNPLCWEDSDFKPGTIIFMGRETSTKYKHITHMALYIGGGYIIHSTAPLGLLHGEVIMIDKLRNMENKYTVPLCAAASPKYHSDYTAEREQIGL